VEADIVELEFGTIVATFETRIFQKRLHCALRVCGLDAQCLFSCSYSLQDLFDEKLRPASVEDDADGHLIYRKSDIIRNRCTYTCRYETLRFFCRFLAIKRSSDFHESLSESFFSICKTVCAFADYFDRITLSVMLRSDTIQIRRFIRTGILRAHAAKNSSSIAAH
jgi:hypothetical protein